MAGKHSVSVSIPMPISSAGVSSANGTTSADDLHTGPIKVLIVDDHPVVRAGLIAMLGDEKGILIVGDAQDGLDAVNKARELCPDIVLMDLRMPVMDGTEAMRHIRDDNPLVRFVVLTTYDSDEYIFSGIEAGARAFLLKDTPGDEMVKAIKAVHRGESLLQSTVASRVLDRLIQISRLRPDSTVISERELEVLRLMAKGMANKCIATKLFVSESTVKARIASIFQKLGVGDRTGAVALALERGLIQVQR